MSVPMDRDTQARLCVAAERMGTGLLRSGAALERIADQDDRHDHRERVFFCGFLAGVVVFAVVFMIVASL